ncbi:MAG: DUF6702 family protein [Gemmatimonadales bacterium]|mgnify:CR=1 FL=1
MLRLLSLLALAAAHPLHTTHTDVVEEHGVVTIQVRAFTDDLTHAVRTRLGAVDDSAMVRYLRGTVTLLDPAGHAVSLTWVGREVQGDITLLRVRATGLTALHGARIRQAMHMELFTDQVNVVVAGTGSQRTTFLFVPGDDPKPLP